MVSSAQQALPVWKERGTKWTDIGWIPGLLWALSLVLKRLEPQYPGHST